MFLRLTKDEVMLIKEEGELTKVQDIILNEYLKDELTDEGIRCKYVIPEHLFTRNKESLFFKIDKLKSIGKLNY